MPKTLPKNRSTKSQVQGRKPAKKTKKSPIIRVQRSVLEGHVRSKDLNKDDRKALRLALKGKKSASLQMRLEEVDYPLLEALSKLPLNSAQLSKIKGLLDIDVNAPIHSVRQFYLSIKRLLSKVVHGYNLEYLLNGRRYPITAEIEYSKSSFFGEWVRLSARVNISGYTQYLSQIITASTFEGLDGEPQPHTIEDVLSKGKFRPLSLDLDEYRVLLRRATKFHEENMGELWSCVNSVVSYQSSFFSAGFETNPFGTEDAPERFIVEPKLELDAEQDRYNYYNRESTVSTLPMVRGFSLAQKRYFFADVRDLKPYKYDTKAIQNLVLPPDMKGILEQIFEQESEGLFSDISVKGKHGGMVILATGRPGTGKTMTAEVFAEKNRRPLYIIEIGELGIDLSSIEQNLQRIFRRASRWNAVLLLDEADVFMAQRDFDFHRSAIVGVFLRLLDYYPGLLFLTSNRHDVIDAAFASRITLTLEYPDLDTERRGIIWKTMFRVAGRKLKGSKFNEIGEIPLNGRQIRNVMRLICCVNRRQTITVDDVRTLCKYSIPEDRQALIGFKATGGN